MGLYPFRGIVSDIEGRLKFYKQDWQNGFNSGFSILSPTIYIFFATALPVVVFGEQLHIYTDGTFSAFETLTATTLCGIIHSVIGGQPLIIMGIAEPTVYIYSDLYQFAKKKDGLGQRLFVAWAAWICVWASLMLIIFAVLGASSITKRFTRIAGELFETLIALIFITQAIKGLIGEFKMPSKLHVKLFTEESLQLPWRYVNGFFGLLLSLGLLLTSLKTRQARSWRYGTASLRAIISDYGVPLMVVVLTAISYSFRESSMPTDVPRRLQSPNPWETYLKLGTVKDMADVPYMYIIAAIVPAIVIAGLLIFDHSVAAQMAEQENFNLQAPPAHHYDMFLLGIMVLMCGLLGLPPISGLVPQSPMHTKSLAKLNKHRVRRKLVEAAKRGIEDRVTLGELYGSMQEAYKQAMIKTVISNSGSLQAADSAASQLDLMELKDLNELKSLKISTSVAMQLLEMHSSTDSIGSTSDQNQSTICPSSPVMQATVDSCIFDPEKDVDALLPVTVNEQRLTNLLQAVMTGASLGAMPLIKLVPVAVLWGYFLFVAMETLQGNQFCERLLLVLTAPSRRYKVLEEIHASFVEFVPFKAIVTFTIFQFVLLVICFGITWIPKAGVLFPLCVFIVVLIRQYILPHFFDTDHLRELDAAHYEEAPPIPHEQAITEAEAHGLCTSGSMRKSVRESDIISEMTTRGRGELKVILQGVEHANSSRRMTTRQIGRPIHECTTGTNYNRIVPSSYNGNVCQNIVDDRISSWELPIGLSSSTIDPPSISSNNLKQ